ncbi:MAG TPA: YqaJ viral recombinase family protein [Terriglobales bacterium]|nr:YqaJ viral recombinase family protein [Terriglobales bacterium]
MKFIPCTQGQPDWHRARMGRPCASEFERVITPLGKATKSEARRDFLLSLLAELILDVPRSTVTTAAMQHGKDQEPKARSAYEMMAGVEVELCGFCTTDDGSAGASPDGLVGDSGLVELKAPFEPRVHLGYLLEPSTLVKEYHVQVQGQLYVTGREWTDLISYFGGMPMVTVRVAPDQEFQAKLAEALRMFCNDLALYVDIAKERGWIKPARPEADHSRDFVTDADVDAILAAQREAK